MKYWDTWYGKSFFAGRADFYHTEMLFHPNGVSLDFHNFSLPHMIVFGGLQTFLPATNAYQLTYLLIIFANALSAYIFLLHLSLNKRVCLVGAVVFGLNPFVVAHPQHPDLAFVATIPLALFALHRGITQKHAKWIVIAGLFAGITAFIGMYIFVCLLLSIGIFLLYFSAEHWRNPLFWQSAVLLVGVIALISTLRVYPMVSDAHGLGEALDKESDRASTSDLLSYFVNDGNPWTTFILARLLDSTFPAANRDGYLGFLPLLFMAFGLCRRRSRRILLPWLFILLFFSLLRIGSAINS